MGAELIGWASALLLLATMAGQVRAQWRSRSVAGVSPWLFRGQLACSAGFSVYSLLQSDWVFVATNLMLLLNAIAGQWIYSRNRRRDEAAPGSVGSRA